MITHLFAGLLTILFIWITLDVIMARRKYKISLGFGPNNEIEGLVSAHTNFSSFVPLLLLLTFLVEQSNAFSSWIVLLIGSLYMMGRLSHFFALSGRVEHFRYRAIGMHLTIWPLLALAIMCHIAFIKGQPLIG